MKALAKGFSFFFRVVRNADKDDCWGMSAELAFQLMLAFVQALILSVAVLSILGANPEVFNSVIYFLGSFLPYEIYSAIRGQIIEISQGDPRTILMLGSIGTTWTMSTVMLTLNKCFQRSYEVKETRSMWKLRIIALIVAILVTSSMAVVLSLLFFGLLVARFLENNIGYANEISTLIRIFRLPVAFAVTTIVASLLYRAMASLKQQIVETLPGALFFCLAWFLLTFCFGIYLRNVPYYNKTYGTLGVFLIMMLWMYLTSLSVLLGGEVNAELHRVKEGPAVAPPIEITKTYEAKGQEQE